MSETRPPPPSPSPSAATCPLLLALSATAITRNSTGAQSRRRFGVEPAGGRVQRSRVGAREEPHQQLVGLVRARALWDVSAVLDRTLRGAGQPLADVATEARRNQPVVAAPDKQRRPG